MADGEAQGMTEENLTRRRFLGRASKYGLAAAVTGSLLVTSTTPALATQYWWWCNKCEGLFNNGSPTLTVCPKDKLPHDEATSGVYVIKFSAEGGAGQDNWRWCVLCGGMHFYPGPGRAGVCVGSAGAGHVVTGSGYYRLETTTNNDGPGGQDQWRWCNKCEGLWFAGHATGVCPAGGGHVSVGSANYVLRVV
jgi:hypothetical protein